VPDSVMIHDLRPYPRYRDSGAPWLGRVPEHWKIARMKTAVLQINEQTAKKQPNDVYVALENVESWTGQVRLLDSTVSFDSQVKKFRRDDVLFGKLRPYLAKVARLSVDGVCVGEFFVLRPRSSDVLPRFLEIMLRSNTIVDVISSSTFGAKMPRADWDFVGSLLVSFPPPPEQAAIVRFLDHADRRIRSYIRAKQTLIELLKEQKQTIIHHAVTRGLDSNVKLKSSGLDWLGQIPEHWTINRNGRLFAQRNQTGFAELPILEVSLRTGVRVRNFDSSDRKQVMSDLSKYKRAVRCDIAYNMMRMWQGAVGVVPVDGLVSPAYIVARPLDGTDPRYFSNLFRTAAYMREVDAYSRGIVKDRNRLYWEDFKQMPSPCPPPNEQARIANALEQMTRSLDEAVTHEMNGIEFLREYRTRLVADVATGKLDVREIGATFFDETGQVEALEETDTVNEGDEASVDSDVETMPEESEA
jgi:type I restriction enzyme S subunit